LSRENNNFDLTESTKREGKRGRKEKKRTRGTNEGEDTEWNEEGRGYEVS
jgi:hypothetical protein